MPWDMLAAPPWQKAESSNIQSVKVKRSSLLSCNICDRTKHGNGGKAEWFYRKNCIDEMQTLRIRRRGPQWVLDELNEFSEDKSYQMICPECDNTMFDNKKMMQASFWKTKPSRTPRQFLAWRVFLISDLFLLSPCSQSSRLVRRFLISGVFSILRFFKFILPWKPAFLWKLSSLDRLKNRVSI